MKKRHVIIAPHADDEIIGCHTLFHLGLVTEVVFGSWEAIEESVPMSDRFGVKVSMLEDYQFDYARDIVLLFPDPTYETHPEHRRIGMIGEELLRAGRDVVFYSTNMLAPYIFETTSREIKRNCLNTLYPAKKDLWKYDHKYFLFEGYTKWIMKWED